MSRPSSALSAKAFTLRSSLLERPCCSLLKENCSFCLSLANNCLGCVEKTCFSSRSSFRLGAFAPSAHCSVPTSKKDLLIKLNGFSLQLSVRYFTLIRFSMNICLPAFAVSKDTRRYPLHLAVLVGPSGLEPPTSCLSGTRSNLLSYEPIPVGSHLPRPWWR